MSLSDAGKKRFRYTVFLICFLSAFVSVTICSKSSPLYPFNDWPDVNCFMTVGKAIPSGMVPYRDLFEQKGPLVYFLFALISFISSESFIGLYLVEIVCGFFFLYYSFKAMELYCGGKAAWSVPFLALAVYTSKAFFHGGSVEELCLPLLTWSLYHFLKAAKTHSGLPAKESFLTGVVSACVFWVKFSLVGIYLGWFLVYAVDMLRQKKVKDFFMTALWIAAGVIAGTLPYVLYFGLNHAVGDWLTGYIYDNVVLYSNVTIGSGRVALSDAFANLGNGWPSIVENNVVLPVLLGTGAVYCLVRRKFTSLLYAGGMVLGTYVLCYAGGRSFLYYSMVFAAFACLGFVPLVLIVSKINDKKRFLTRWFCLGYALVAAAMFFLTPNRYLMGADRDGMPQFRFAKIIRETPDATLLNLGFLDGGFYTAAGMVPNCRAFCALNIWLPELRGQQVDFVRNAVCDFVVTRDESLDGYDLDGNYTLIDMTEYVLEGKMWTYRLYGRVAGD